MMICFTCFLIEVLLHDGCKDLWTSSPALSGLSVCLDLSPCASLIISLQQ